MKSLNNKNLPDSPGVYIFSDKNSRILYIGRATSLRKRTANYFRKFLDPRIKEMVEKSKCLRFIKTDTVLESIFLEANLIKKYWPKYNIKDRDNRSFVYIFIPDIDYPYPMIIRERELEKFQPIGKIFGPYQSESLIRSALRIIRRIFPYSSCVPNSGKACFNYQIGLCPGVCIGAISKKDYLKNIKNIVDLISGRKNKLLKRLEKENPDKIKNLEHIRDVALISRFEPGKFCAIKKIEGYDISHLTGKETYGSMAVFADGKPDKKQYRLFKVKTAKANDDLASLAEVLERRLNHQEWNYPDLILIDGGRPQIAAMDKILENKFLNIPLVGISKFGNDKLVFGKHMKKDSKNLIEAMKGVLQQVRDESHRFANKASRSSRTKNFLPQAN